MKIDDAAKLLRDMYNAALPKEKAVSVHMFGIRYAEQIGSMSPRDLAIRAGLPESYKTEIRKGINLARYVEPRRQ